MSFPLIQKPRMCVDLEGQKLVGHVAEHFLDIAADERFATRSKGDRLTRPTGLIDNLFEKVETHHAHMAVCGVGKFRVGVIAEDAPVVANRRWLNLQARRKIVQYPGFRKLVVAVAIVQVPAELSITDPFEFFDNMVSKKKRRAV